MIEMRCKNDDLVAQYRIGAFQKPYDIRAVEFADFSCAPEGRRFTNGKAGDGAAQGRCVAPSVGPRRAGARWTWRGAA